MKVAPIVLVVDDAALIRGRATAILQRHGYRVVPAEDGHVAVARYQQFAPDAVLMDVMMPRLDGISALHQIRAMDPDAQVAIVTGTLYPDDLAAATRSGVKLFVRKPFDSALLIAAVNFLVQKPFDADQLVTAASFLSA
jgi:two-component system, chemotaxis family, chemotaxis protein CheY